MAMRALLRGAAARSRGSRSAVAAADASLPISREYRLDVASSAISCSSSTCASFPVSQLPKSSGFPSWPGPSSHSVSALLHSFSLSSSSSSSAYGALRIPSQVSSFLISAPSVAPLSVLSAGLRRPLADLRVGNVYESAQQLGGDYSIFPWMQQKRSLSKLKKYKMKSYSSYKERFRLMADGTYKRWRSGTRHNAHSKTAKQRRQLRRPSIAPAALATVMKKLNFVL